MTTVSGGAFPAPTSLESLKRHAKRIQRQTGIKYSMALNRAAQQAGYADFRSARAGLAPADPQQPRRQRPADPRIDPERRQAWAEAVRRIPRGRHAIWTEWFEIRRILHEVLGSGAGVCMLPGMGHLYFKDAIEGIEPQTLNLVVDGGAMRICRPRKLEMHYIPTSPADSFFLMHLDTLPLTEVHDEERHEFILRRGQEEVAVTPDGAYHDRELSDNGELPDARLMVRFLRGKMMFTSASSLWRLFPGHDMGMHEREDPREIFRTLEQLASRLQVD